MIGGKFGVLFCKYKFVKKFASICFAVLFTLQIFNVLTFAEVKTSNKQIDDENLSLTDIEGSYDYYLSEHKNYANNDTEVSFKNIISLDNASILDNKIIFGKENSSATFKVYIKETGLYNLFVEYSSVVDLGKAMQVGIKVNGEYPYDEASRVNLEQVWIDDLSDNTVFKSGADGNDILPNTIQLDTKINSYLFDNEGFYSTPLMFFLEAGENQITLNSNGDAFILYTIALTAPVKYLSYDEYKANNKSLSNNVNEGYLYKIQAEHPTKKSDSSLYAAVDRSDPNIEPMSSFGNKRNIIGTNNWKNPGQYLEWEFDAPESGYYKLGFKYRQNTNRGLYNLRKLYIDGEVPFSEALSLKFEYTDGFEIMTPGNEAEDYMFYLKKGKHTIRLEVTLGENSSVLRTVDNQRLQLSNLVQRIMMITSVKPDLYRDYYLEDQIPTMVDELKNIADILLKQMDGYEKSTGQKSTNATTLEESAEQLYEFAEKTYLIPEKLSTLSGIVSNLATWINGQKDQLLELDYIVVSSVGNKMPDAEASFIKKLWHEIKMTIYSFTSDYSISSDDKNSIEVWMSGGRDQRDILKELINSSELEFDVQLKLVTASVTNAIMAGIGPDVVLKLGRTEPVNLGMRGALEPLNKFTGFDELKKQYSKEAFVPYTLEGNIYAVPITEMFDVMFIRTDVFENLGLEIPGTWDEFFSTVRILQQNKMEAGLPTNLFATLLYQKGGSYFNNDMTALNFNNDTAFSTFEKWVKLYTEQSFSLFKSDYNRFRSGEMPMMISPYSLYNQIYAAAPEIRNDWEMCLIPGTLKDDGSVDRTNVADMTGTVSVILADSKNKENAWNFVKWWSDYKTQSAYGKRIEYIMGVAGRYTPSNCEAFKQLAWSSREMNVLLSQWETVRQIPEVPGGYYVTRNMDNAFRACTTRNVDIKETFSYWMNETDKEITRKRNQYIVS